MNGKFLVVDDEKGMRDILAAILRIKGIEDSRVVLAVDGQDAWEQFSKDPMGFSVIITDVDMPPGMNGVELIQRVLEKSLGIKIVYMSGRPVPAVGGAIFLQKPFDLERLWQEIQSYA